MAKSNYYPDNEAEPIPPKDTPAVENPEEEEMEGETFLVNKSALGDVEVGDECTIRIVAMHDGEAECEYVKDKSGTDPEAEDKLPDTIGARMREKLGG